jgi:hypothetical protein
VKSFILALFLILAAFGRGAGRCAADDEDLSFGVVDEDDGYVSYYPDETYYDYSYPDAYDGYDDGYGYYVPDYNWNSGVGSYGGWYGVDHDHWRGEHRWDGEHHWDGGQRWNGGEQHSEGGRGDGAHFHSHGGAGYRSGGGFHGGGHR